MVKQVSLGKPTPPTRLVKEMRMEEERMRDVLLLIEHLISREETTVRLILDCLYDVGSVNLINQRLRRYPLNQLMKWVAQLSKPLFRIVALRWFKKNCPELLVNWLYTKVKFERPQDKPEATIAAISEVQSNPPLELETYNREILKLHSQIRMLTVLLIGVTVTLGGGFAWSVWRGQVKQVQSINPVRAIVSDVSSDLIHAISLFDLSLD